MKTEDIERLKSICEENGFEIKSESQSGLLYYIDKKDPWDGVEFAKGLVNIEGYLKEGEVIKISKIAEKWNDGHKHVFYQRNGKEDYTHITNVTPSTESEYVEQLKKEAFERFGEIKDQDRFEKVWKPGKAIVELQYGGFKYFKEYDQLTYGGICIYNSSKWATKLPEKAKVIPDLYYDHLSHSEEHHVFAFEIKNLSDGYSVAEVSNFLAKQLENYLNDNQK